MLPSRPCGRHLQATFGKAPLMASITSSAENQFSSQLSSCAKSVDMHQPCYSCPIVSEPLPGNVSFIKSSASSSDTLFAFFASCR